MVKLLLLLLLVAYKPQEEQFVPSVEEYVSPHEWQPQEIKLTYYIWTGNRTASGVYPKIGMCASNREHLGDVAVIYNQDKECIGMFECTDIGGTEGLKKGFVIDIYAHDMETVYQFAEDYGTSGYVLWVEVEE